MFPSFTYINCSAVSCSPVLPTSTVQLYNFPQFYLHQLFSFIMFPSFTYINCSAVSCSPVLPTSTVQLYNFPQFYLHQLFSFIMFPSFTYINYTAVSCSPVLPTSTIQLYHFPQFYLHQLFSFIISPSFTYINYTAWSFPPVLPTWHGTDNRGWRHQSKMPENVSWRWLQLRLSLLLTTGSISFKNTGRKEGNVLFSDALNTFYLRLYGVGHIVKYHSDSERGNPLPPHRLLFPINSKFSFICIIRQTG